MKRAGEILAAFFDHAQIKVSEQTGDLFSASAWPELLETCGLSRGISHSRIVDLADTVLQIEADHPGWIQLLQTKQRELLNAAGKRFPEITITGMTFRLGK